MSAPVRYPCQDRAGLPAGLAELLDVWAARSEVRVSGRCILACEAIATALEWPDGLVIVGGCARFGARICPHTGRDVGGMLHWWLGYEGRIIDPTRQQFGRGPVTYWRARAAYQGAGGWRLVRAAHALIERDEKGLDGAAVFAALCEPEPCYQDQGWQRARPLRKAA